MTGENLLSLLERRLDNVVFRIGLGSSRKQARQLVLHGHFLVNGKKVNIPSFLVKSGDKITVSESSRDALLIKSNAEAAKNKRIPSWIQMDFEKLEAQITGLPKREDIDVAIQDQLVVEFYSR